MNRLLDGSLVSLALAASITYALGSLGPKSLRQRMRARLARLAAGIAHRIGLGRMARRLEATAANPAAGACGGCHGSCSEGGDQSRDGAPEVRVPLDLIGKR
ncbi:MAG TPA: DUF6587 family protein [Steroidobacteraceae bacterium]|nr:DUF6587 family protein [Steroidobacteraceae bacterium]